MKTIHLRLGLVTLASCVLGVLSALLLRPSYVLDWPLDERDGARLFVDGQPIPLSEENPLRIRGNWFASKLRLTRDDHQSLEIDLRSQEPLSASQPFRPSWTPTETRQLKQSIARLVDGLDDALASSSTPAADYIKLRKELLGVASRLKPAVDPQHAQLAEDVGRVLDQLPHPLQRVQPSQSNRRLWSIGSHTLCHSKPVSVVAVSPDGQLVASGSADGGIMLHRADDGRLLASLFEHAQGITSLVFSPMSNALFSSGYDGRVVRWDLQSYKPQSLASSPGSINRLAISPDGKQLAFDASSRNVTLWMLDEAQPRWKYLTESRVHELRFLPESQQLAVLHERALELIDLAQGTVVIRIENSVAARQFTYEADRDELRLIGQEESVVWSLSRYKENFRFSTQPGLIAIDASRAWFAQFQRRKPECRIKLNWQDENYFLPIGQRNATCVDFAPEHAMAVTGTIGGGLFIHHLQPFRQLAPVPPRVSWHQVAFDQTGDRLILVSGSGTVALVDCHTRRLSEVIEGNGVHAQQLFVSGATDELWIEDQFGLRSIALDNSGRRQQVEGAGTAAMTSDGRYLAFTRKQAESSAIYLLDLKNANESIALEKLQANITQLVFGEHERVLYAMDSVKRLLQLDIERGQVQPLETPAEIRSVEQLQWIGGGLVFAAGTSIYTWDRENNRLDQVELDGKLAGLVGRGWSDRWLAMSPGNVHWFDGDETNTLQIGSFGQRYSSIALSHCCRYLAVALGDGRVEVYPLE